MVRVFCKLTNSFVSSVDKGVFFSLEKYIMDSGEGADKDSFDVIKSRLQNPPVFCAREFAFEVFYVILASGFRQKVAKQKFLQIVKFIDDGGEVVPENLIKIFGNKNKINAICKVWKYRDLYRDGFYRITDVDEKLNYLEKLPYIGAITKNHIARNLGINKVKYDVWIQRLGVALYGDEGDVVGSPLSLKTKAVCDKMFEFVSSQTGLCIGYIDVVLWKSCQIGLLEFRE